LAAAAMLLCIPGWSQSVPPVEIIGPRHTIRDPLYSWSARFPSDWIVDGVVRWGDRETNLYLRVPAVPSAFSTLYYKSHAKPQPIPANAEYVMRKEAERHAIRRIVNGLTSYTPQAGSFSFKHIGGHPALLFVAHFSSDNRTICEYVVRVMSERGVAQMMLRVPLVQFEAVRANFEAMADTLLLP
jgi:hypothetical protein